MLELLLSSYEVKRSQRHLLDGIENKRLGSPIDTVSTCSIQELVYIESIQQAFKNLTIHNYEDRKAVIHGEMFFTLEGSFNFRTETLNKIQYVVHLREIIRPKFNSGLKTRMCKHLELKNDFKQNIFRHVYRII